YIQDEIRLTDRLTVNAGIRRDYYHQTGAQLNPRAAVIYKLTDTAAVKLLAGRAFRAPSSYELYYQDSGNTAKANPNLQPETIKTYEAVFENRFSEHWMATFSVFHYQMNDLIDQTIDPDDNLMQYRNISQVTADGYEAALIGKWQNGLQTRASLASAATLDKSTRSKLANSPAHLVNFGLIYPLLEEKLFAGLDIKYISKRKTLSGGHTDDAVITNLTLTYDNVLNNLDMQLGLYNLFDVKYEHPGFIEHLQDTIEQDGRTFGIKLTYRF
ncbi:MAG TPA: TonB-dependent receptor, partial [Anaerohalosphaeraceae bacterium]|nr:TonB-dependent receptor [Anaerohalosphaeraceae bacterium]